ncbi:MULTISPECIES: glycosyltransferase family 4 protein [Schaalia]|nr:glycosyltransferase family 4 protein [Schaalia hyovaginalis]MCI7512987.1 glycosyltransferase family 4 protein [Schaalia hyovaginalis]MDY4491592.1 glycosyltransferase family 4 protein [Schaalia hyovaginalis]
MRAADRVIAIRRATANLLSRIPLLASSAARMATDDPAHFAIQVARRIPRRVRDLASQIPAPSTAGSTPRALWMLALDRSSALRAELEDSPRSSPLLDAARVQVGARLPEDATPTARARSLWEQGDLDEAIAIAPAKLRRRLEARLRVLTPGTAIELSSRIATAPAEERPGDRPMRILHALTNSLPWTNSGYAIRSHGVLTAQRRAGLEVEAATRLAYPVTIGRPWASDEDRIDGIVYRRLLPLRLPALEDDRLALHARLLADKAEAFGPDIIHTTTNFHNALVARAVARSLGIPWVYEFRGELEKSWVARRPHEEEARALASQRYRLMRARETELAITADAVVALSRHQADSLVRRGIAAEKILIAPNAVDDALLAEQRDPPAARTRLGLPPGKRLIGTVSAIVDYEGLDVLVDAVAGLKASGLDLMCAIIGDGVSRESLIQRALALGLVVARSTEEISSSTDILLPGRVAPQTALDWYRALDVMTIPRRDTPVTRAVTPIKGLQAMALGIPQVVSDLPALVEIAASEGQGLAVPAQDGRALADAIAQVLDDEALAKDLSSAARTAASHRTWRALGCMYAELYTSLVP